VSHKRASFAGVLGAATLHFLLVSGCALETRTGDGIVGDPYDVTVAPSVVYATAGQPDSGINTSEVAGCMGPALTTFQQKVVPHFLTRCFECHDGTKSKALLAINMSTLKTDVRYACLMALYLGANLPDKQQAPLITSADPARTDKEHDFKYEDLAEFNTYRTDVLSWLALEKP
jgi:hypothetical protein